LPADKPSNKTFSRYPIGYFHIDIAEGKLSLLVAVDRTSRFAFAQLHLKAGKMISSQQVPTPSTRC
jgi:RNA-directed DNA polymerase